MIRRTLIPFLVLLATLSSVPSADANGFGSGFRSVPYFSGFYQPYGIRYSTSVPTPPYFAVNPPVYYGARHTRPYGVSPFASLPLVEAGDDYRSRPYPATLAPPPVLCNPFCPAVEELPPAMEPATLEIEPADAPLAAGLQRANPFATTKLAASGRSLQ